MMIRSPLFMRRRGFSLIDLLMTVAVLAVVAAIAVPALTDNHRLRVRGAAAIITSDIEFAQSMTLAFPNDPVVMVFDPADSSYRLAFSSDPDTPLTRPDTGEEYVVVLGSGRARATEGVTFTVQDMTDSRIAFSPYGGLESFPQTPKVLLSHSQNSDLDLRLTIEPMTGTVSEQWHN